LKVLASNIGNSGAVVNDTVTVVSTLPIAQNLGNLVGWNNGKSIAPPIQTGTQSYAFDLRASELKSTPNQTLLISVEGDGTSQINGIDPVYINGNYRIFTLDQAGLNLLQINNSQLPVTSYDL
jgi:hypothetical protein